VSFDHSVSRRRRRWNRSTRRANAALATARALVSFCREPRARLQDHTRARNVTATTVALARPLLTNRRRWRSPESRDARARSGPRQAPGHPRTCGENRTASGCSGHGVYITSAQGG
jgi:hypothetical protein